MPPVYFLTRHIFKEKFKLMPNLTRQIFQAIACNGYKVREDRKQRPGGTMVWLISEANNNEVFYFFDDESEADVVETMAWQYCTAAQLETIFEDAALKMACHLTAEIHHRFA